MAQVKKEEVRHAILLTFNIAHLVSSQHLQIFTVDMNKNSAPATKKKLAMVYIVGIAFFSAVLLLLLLVSKIEL